ncbi:transmembrane protein 200C-like isoform X2 [Epinephelus fuscoguttatus]|uniref:transmembrane protein 200C-like isoform X2 n=1 Tax=Epinephelus fuscoguttatus TaxID=293821 RepID=UPI0020D0B760|nr:transmembrane protein 200C-like isoform X2 [Epinephelus fuscoguttatus]
MIATGGLLRINARRQDSLRSKTHKAHTHKRKNKKKRNEVVVVKGKLKLFSVSGLVAALGILVLLVGVVMAALGYWPRDGLFFSAHPQEGAAMASVSSSSAAPAPASAPAPADAQGEVMGEELQGDEGNNRGRGEEGDGGGRDDGFNRTETINGTTRQLPRGFLEDFLERYLYSDRLKVFGPLIMGIGIFLFICANAVLHENRDKKTKVINLRDIYSTVIDLHSLRKPNTSSARRSSANPLNGLVNYVQSKSLEAKPRAYPASLLNRREAGGGGEGGGGPLSRQSLPSSSRGGGGGGGGGGGSDGEGGDTVFSIYQEQPDTPPPPSSSHRLSLPPSFSPPHLSTCWTSLQKEALSSFTLPRPHPRPSTPRRRHSARAGTGRGRVGGTGGEDEWRREGGGHRQEEEKVYACPPPPLSSSTPPPSAASCSSSSLHREAPGGSQALLLLSSSSLTPSHLSLSSLSHLLSSTSSTPAPSCRRRSLPTGSSATGYSKLTHGEDESFESTEMTSSYHVTSQGGGERSEEVTSHRKYSNREKLRMISQVDSGLRQEEEG